jgi:glycosyltransferase involved in cell wall biosynthesis
MKFLFVCQQNPWRLDSGALIRNYWMIRALAREHEVHLATADESDDPLPEDFRDVCASIEHFPRATGVFGRIGRVLGALRPASSYFTSGAVVPAMRRAVATFAAQPHAAIMIDFSMLDALGTALVPIIFNAHNVEYELLLRRAAREREPLRSLLRIEATRTRRLETRFLQRSLLVAACSQDDRDELARLDAGSLGKILVVPNGVDVVRYENVAACVPTTRRILVTGSFDWQPNLLGLRWFVDEVLPALRARAAFEPDIRVAGRMSDALAARLDALPGVTAVPRPADMRVELEGARIVLAPIVASSGTRLRILEAWAAGRPVATTPSGAFGLRYVAGRELLVAESAVDLADAANRLLTDDDVWRRIRAEGLVRAREYDWHTIGNRFMAEAAPALEGIPRPY